MITRNNAFLVRVFEVRVIKLFHLKMGTYTIIKSILMEVNSTLLL